MITFRTQCNSKKWEHTLINDRTQLILARNGSRTPGCWALTHFLTYSHIFASSSHLTIIFTYMETPRPPLSSYVHFILLCRLPPMSARLVYGIVDAGAYELTFVLTTTTTTFSNTLATLRKQFFSILGDNVAH